MKNSIDSVLKRLRGAVDVAQEALALGFVPDDNEQYGVGLPDDGHAVKGDFFLYDTTWRKRSLVRKHAAAVDVAPLWLIEWGPTRGMGRSRRAWSRSME